LSEIILYIHGKGGNAAEAEHYRPLFPDADVIGFDYHAETPWDAMTEFRQFYETVTKDHAAVSVIANSIGAFFTLHALHDLPVKKAWFISPIADMEELILNMMLWANVTEEDLRLKGTIDTALGETLSWEYLSWVRTHPVRWQNPAAVLYGSGDTLQSAAAIRSFAQKIAAPLTVMENGEHWFHTEEQMAFLDKWIKGM